MRPSIVTVGIESIFITHDFVCMLYVGDQVLWNRSVRHMLSLGGFTKGKKENKRLMQWERPGFRRSAGSQVSRFQPLESIVSFEKVFRS